jgi:DNA repair exonuclease SbcCD ATPase subunit
MAKMYTLTEAQEQLGINPKTFRRWLEKANINPDTQVSHLDNRIKFLTEEQVVKLAHDHGVDLDAPRAKTAEIIPPGAYKLLIERIDNAEHNIQLFQDDLKNAWLIIGTCQQSIIKLEEQLHQAQTTIDGCQQHIIKLEEQLHQAQTTTAEHLNNVERDMQLHQDDLKNAWLIIGSCQQSIIKLEEQLHQAQETIITLQRPQQEHPRKAKDAPESVERLPEGLISWRAFADLHHVSQTTTSRSIASGFIKVIRGKWKVSNGYIKEALDTQGRRDFWVQFHSTSSFTTCDNCPHELPETV